MKNTVDTELTWDSRPFTLTLAGCLTLAGMPLADEAVAQTMPKTTQEIMNDPERVPAPASCLVCQIANIHGCLSCRDTSCPNPLPDTETTRKEREAFDHVEAVAFGITDEKSANWYLRKLANIEAEKARLTAQYEKMIADLEADANGLKFLYEGELKEYVQRELMERGGKKKTLHLLQGTCSFRSIPASVRVADPFAALDYAKQNGLPCIVTQERIDAEAYKELADGKLLPGMDTTPEREAFTVKFGTK